MPYRSKTGTPPRPYTRLRVSPPPRGWPKAGQAYVERGLQEFFYLPLRGPPLSTRPSTSTDLRRSTAGVVVVAAVVVVVVAAVFVVVGVGARSACVASVSAAVVTAVVAVVAAVAALSCGTVWAAVTGVSVGGVAAALAAGAVASATPSCPPARSVPLPRVTACALARGHRGGGRERGQGGGGERRSVPGGVRGGFIVPPGILRRLPGRPGEEAEAAHEEAANDSLTRGPRGLVGLRAPLSPVGP